MVLDLRSQNPEAISTSSLESCQPEVRKGDVVLLCTGWADRFGGSGYMDDFPYLTEDAAEWLAERKVKLLGLDTLGPDIAPPRQPPGFSFPVHKILLSRQVLIAEKPGCSRSFIGTPRVCGGPAPEPLRGRRLPGPGRCGAYGYVGLRFTWFTMVGRLTCWNRRRMFEPSGS